MTRACRAGCTARSRQASSCSSTRRACRLPCSHTSTDGHLQLSAQFVQTFIDNYGTALAQGWNLKVLPVTSLVSALDVCRNGAGDSAAADAVSLAVAQASPSALPSFVIALPSSHVASASTSVVVSASADSTMGHTATGAPLSASSSSASTSAFASASASASASAPAKKNGPRAATRAPPMPPGFGQATVH
jgi:hypothetical protein